VDDCALGALAGVDDCALGALAGVDDCALGAPVPPAVEGKCSLTRWRRDEGVCARGRSQNMWASRCWLTTSVFWWWNYEQVPHVQLMSTA